MRGSGGGMGVYRRRRGKGKRQRGRWKDRDSNKGKGSMGRGRDKGKSKGRVTIRSKGIAREVGKEAKQKKYGRDFEIKQGNDQCQKWLLNEATKKREKKN